MFALILTEKFDKSFSKIRNKDVQSQIWNKIKELEKNAPIGKKLAGNPYWSIHINKFRVIYELRKDQVVIADVLRRKFDYREV